jgi:hypothetical protein
VKTGENIRKNHYEGPYSNYWRSGSRYSVIALVDPSSMYLFLFRGQGQHPYLLGYLYFMSIVWVFHVNMIIRKKIICNDNHQLSLWCSWCTRFSHGFQHLILFFLSQTIFDWSFYEQFKPLLEGRRVIICVYLVTCFHSFNLLASYYRWTFVTLKLERTNKL